ncbi:MAG: alpha-glucan family phosphorylase [Gemmatimonadota bacterium]
MQPWLPDPLRPLQDLAYNLRWTWNHPTRELFRQLDPELWEETQRNPVLLLRRIDPRRLERAAHDEAFLARFRDAHRRLHEHLASAGWYGRRGTEDADLRVAYFAAEFGLAECIPLYSGGLGILSGDHLKSASELGVPLTAVGLLYRHGYFTQRLGSSGRQEERYPVTEVEALPVVPETRPDGRNLTVTLDFPGREVHAEVWRVDVGRVRLLLLDTRIEANRPEDQVITGALYAGNRETRLQQEIVLGVGGLRALAALRLRPGVCHMNEGHAAFLVLERIRLLMEEDGLSFAQARQAARAGNVFTTHTPVPAGFDLFEPSLLRPYFWTYAERLGIGWEEFLALGGSDGASPFSMAVLALTNASRVNAVSPLHAEVSRDLFRGFAPPQPEAAERLEAVSNGIHTRSWIAPEMKELLTRHLGAGWLDELQDASVWDGVERIPDAELWDVRERRRAKLVHWVRRRLPQQLDRRGADPAALAWARVVLDPSALTLGWARRFAGYKRATLLFRDVDRLRRLIGDPSRPVQVVLAGKAHPHDEEGKAQIAVISALAADPELRERVVLLANYDIGVARMLVRGVDVWLNTPRRPLEASGTSGMKVVANGGLHASVLDGWWAEAYAPEVGWAIGGGTDDAGSIDEADQVALLELLEREVVPLFYDRGGGNLPQGWVAKMKASMRRLCPVYNTNRMVQQYTEQLYLPSHRESGQPAAGARTGAAGRQEREQGVRS